jgi:hypothetical protein
VCLLTAGLASGGTAVAAQGTAVGEAPAAGVSDPFARTAPAVGTVAPDLTLPRIEGGTFDLRQALADGPVLIRLATPT